MRWRPSLATRANRSVSQAKCDAGVDDGDDEEDVGMEGKSGEEEVEEEVEDGEDDDDDEASEFISELEL